jgi:hypothetical protein
MEYYTIYFIFRPLYIGYPQVFLKLTELQYKEYGVFFLRGGGVISFTILGGMNQNFWDSVFNICCSLFVVARLGTLFVCWLSQVVFSVCL